MKIRCEKDEIVEGLQIVQSVVSTRGTLPILANVLLDAEGKELSLTTTDLEVGMKKNVKAAIAKKGAITLPAKRLLALLRALPVREVTLETSDQREAIITYGRSYFKVLGLPKDEFPQLPDFKKMRSLKIKQAPLKGLIRKTHYAISHDESRYVLNGLYLVIAKGRITGVATDGRRLALCEIAAEVPDGSDRGLIIPTKAVVELGRILSDEGDIALCIGENQVAFSLDGCTLVTRLIEGHFPNYQQVIPQRSEVSLTLDREELLAATRRVALLTSEQSNSIKMAFRKNRLILSTSAPEVGEAKEELTITYAGKDLEIAFNPNYLMDVLKNLDEREITLEFTDALDPGVIRCGSSFLHVIMPIRMS